MVFIITTITELLALLFMMRFYMRCCLVGGNAPLASFVARITNPFARLLNPLLPKFSRIDLSAILLAYVMMFAQVYITQSLQWLEIESLQWIQLLDMAIYAVVKLIKIFLDLLFFAILATVVLSWVSHHSPNPISIQLLYPLTDWILEPVRRIVPNLGMIDISPMIILFVLQFVENFVVNRLLNL